MAAEEANIELFNVFLNQPTSLSIVNVKVRLYCWNEDESQSHKLYVFNVSLFTHVLDIQWKHGPAHRQLSAKPHKPSGHSETADEKRSRPRNQKL